MHSATTDVSHAGMHEQLRVQSHPPDRIPCPQYINVSGRTGRRRDDDPSSVRSQSDPGAAGGHILARQVTCMCARHWPTALARRSTRPAGRLVTGQAWPCSPVWTMASCIARRRRGRQAGACTAASRVALRGAATAHARTAGWWRGRPARDCFLPAAALAVAGRELALTGARAVGGRVPGPVPCRARQHRRLATAHRRM